MCVWQTTWNNSMSKTITLLLQMRGCREVRLREVVWFTQGHPGSKVAHFRFKSIEVWTESEYRILSYRRILYRPALPGVCFFFFPSDWIFLVWAFSCVMLNLSTSFGFWIWKTCSAPQGQSWQPAYHYSFVVVIPMFFVCLFSFYLELEQVK